MKESTPTLTYEATAFEDGQTAHGLLVTAYQKAVEFGFFDLLDKHVKVTMRTKDYSPNDKIKTLWASIVLGCDHTKQINTELGAHEPDLARLFGFSTARFPDQSGINTLLRRFTDASVGEFREVAFELLCQHSRAHDRHTWLRLPGGRRRLVVDIDQRGLVVRGKTFELAEDGFYGRKRGRKGYQLSLAFLGGALREVLDEYLDGGKTPAGFGIADLLARLAQACTALGIAPEDVLVRADAQYGTPAIIEQIAACGFQYLIKGISPQRAAKLLARVGSAALFELATGGAVGEAWWVSDLGWVEHEGEPREGVRPRIRARTIVGAWMHEVARTGSRPGAASRAKRRREGRTRERVVTMESWLTSLPAEDLPAVVAIETYNARQTIEAYFKDEQQALGARHVRTKVFAGSAVFQWLVAITNNLLRWMQQEVFAGTVLEDVRLTRLVKEAMAIPARIRREGPRVVVALERRHPLVKCLLTSWKPLLHAQPPVWMPLPVALRPTGT
jgi:hypothetical protein